MFGVIRCGARIRRARREIRGFGVIVSVGLIVSNLFRTFGLVVDYRHECGLGL